MKTLNERCTTRLARVLRSTPPKAIIRQKRTIERRGTPLFLVLWVVHTGPVTSHEIGVYCLESGDTWHTIRYDETAAAAEYHDACDDAMEAMPA